MAVQTLITALINDDDSNRNHFRQLLQHPMIIVCLVQMPNGFMDDFRAVKGCNSSYDSSNSFRICTLEK
jgi:hypothetical protein